MLRKKAIKNSWRYIDFTDLVSSQIEITRLSYDTHSGEYARRWEWNKEIAGITLRDYLDPFMKHVAPNGVVLVVGCGTGRDLSVLGQHGYRYLGIDSSVGMLREAVEVRKIDGPVLCTDIESLEVVDKSFDGVLIDSAVEHIKKVDMEGILEKIFSSLKGDGVCLLRFRLGDGRVFEVEDEVGVRYFTSYTRSESGRLVTSNGFKVVKEYETDHMENSRPRFHTYILRK